MKPIVKMLPLLCSAALLAACAPMHPACDQLCQNINMDKSAISAGLMDPRFLQYDLAEQKARDGMKHAIADHDTAAAQLLQMQIDQITKERTALDIAERPRAQRQALEAKQKMVETLSKAPPMSNVDPAAYAHTQAPAAGGDDQDQQQRETLRQQQEFDEMVRREHGQ